MRRRLLVGNLLPLYCSTLSFLPSSANFGSSFVCELWFFLRLRTLVLSSFANFGSFFVCELWFFLRLRTLVLPSFANFRSSFVVARVRDLLLSFLRATHGWGWLPSRNVPTKSFETFMYGLGTLSFFTTKQKPSNAH
jgi:hypothetical protein